jgi:hypothetical protein
VLAHVSSLHATGGAVASELKRLEKAEHRLASVIERLTVAVETGDGSLATLTARLAERERELVIVRSQRQDLEEQSRVKAQLPSTAKLLEHLMAVKDQLIGEESRAAVFLRQLLAAPIRVMPYMRIDGKKVVPRIEIDLNLVSALPPGVATPLRRTTSPTEPPEILKRSLLVDVAYHPQLVQHALVTVERRKAGLRYATIAKELGLSLYNMKNCALLCRLMQQQGHTDRYRRLTDKPDHVPKWRSKHWVQAGDRKGGGKRRRAS